MVFGHGSFNLSACEIILCVVGKQLQYGSNIFIADHTEYDSEMLAGLRSQLSTNIGKSAFIVSRVTNYGRMLMHLLPSSLQAGELGYLAKPRPDGFIADGIAFLAECGNNVEQGVRVLFLTKSAQLSI